MTRIAYVNGRYLPLDSPAIRVEDRGYQFADAIYEVIALAAGWLVDGAAHLDRLERSLGEIDLPMPMSRRALAAVLAEVARRNRVRDGVVYLQISRGSAAREAAFPASSRPVLSVTTRPVRGPTAALREAGVAVVTVPDQRWRRRDIKSVALLPNVLAKQRAVAAGAYEAWMLDDGGRITEGSTTNAWIVTAKGVLRTHPTGPEILAGVTRAHIAALAAGEGLKVEERAFTVAEAAAAAEAFLTSTTVGALAVTRIDGHVIGGGTIGPVCRRLSEAYLRFARMPGQMPGQMPGKIPGKILDCADAAP